MKIIIYTNPDKQYSASFLKAIPGNADATTVAVFDFRGFTGMIRSELSGQVIAVLIVSSVEELEFFASNKVLLSGSPVIVILVENSRKMVPLALTLKPKFLAYAQKDLDAVCAVIKKLIGK